jgi:hypothetical protein
VIVKNMVIRLPYSTIRTRRPILKSTVERLREVQDGIDARDRWDSLCPPSPGGRPGSG